MARNLNCNRYSCYSSETVTIIFAKPIDKTGKVCYNKPVVPDGGIAQLGERLNGIQEVRGSTPLISTTHENVPYIVLVSKNLHNIWDFSYFRYKSGTYPQGSQCVAEVSPAVSSVPGRALSTSPSPTM